jgi:hypothetical protein
MMGIRSLFQCNVVQQWTSGHCWNTDATMATKDNAEVAKTRTENIIGTHCYASMESKVMWNTV